MVHPAQPRYRYAIDRHDLIKQVCPLWLAFARENGAPQLSHESVTGRSLWEFIDGAETKRLYQAILARVRTSILQVVLPFRCDSPTLRRHMRLEITPQPDDCIQFEGVLERAEPTTPFSLLESTFPRSHHMLTLCSFCKRVLVETCGWLEIEDAVVRLHLLEKRKVPRLCNTVCPKCAAAALLVPSHSQDHSANAAS